MAIARMMQRKTMLVLLCIFVILSADNIKPIKMIPLECKLFKQYLMAEKQKKEFQIRLIRWVEFILLQPV